MYYQNAVINIINTIAILAPALYPQLGLLDLMEFCA